MKVNCQVISGIIKDSGGKTVAYATIGVKRNSDTLTINCVSDTTGYYRLKVPSRGIYSLTVSYLQNAINLHAIAIQGDTTIDFVLPGKTKNIQEVVVTGKQANFFFQGDRFIYRPKENLKKTSDGLEVLQQTPLLNITQHGINLIGKGDAVVYINHHPAQMAGEILMNYLQTMSGTNIKQIDIVTNPGSQFDSNIKSGIIDIILKQNIDEGWKYLLGQTTRRYSYYWNSGYAEADYHKNKFNLSITPYYNNEIKKSSFTQESQTRSNFYQMGNLTGKRSPLNIGIQTSIDYYISSKQILNWSNILYKTKTNFPSSNYQVYSTIEPAIRLRDSSSETYTTSKEISKNLFGSFNYTNSFDTLGQLLTINLNYNIFKNNENTFGSSNMYRDTQYPTSVFKFASVNPLSIYNSSIKLDYIKPLSKHISIEPGIQFNNTETITASTWNTDTQQSNKVGFLINSKFSLSENIYTAFVSLSINKLFTDKIQLTLGGRLEHYSYHGNNKVDNQYLVINKTNAFPNIILSFAPNSTSQLVFSSSGKIRRPDFGFLNSSISYESPTLYYVGNPFLQPTISYDQQLTYAYKEKYYCVVDAINSRKNMAQFFLPDNSKPNLFYSKQFNYGNSLQYSIALGCNNSFLKGLWDINATIQGLYAKYKSDSSFPIVFSREGYSANLSFSNIIHLSKSHNVQGLLDFSYATKIQIDNALIYRPISSVSVGLKKTWSHLRISVYIYDPYQGMNQYAKLTPNAYQINNVARIFSDSRGVSINIKYSFGNNSLKAVSSLNSGNEDYKQRSKN